MIECTLMPMKKYSSILDADDKTEKYGKYLNAHWPLKGFGKKCWLVVVHIDINYEALVNEEKTLEDVVIECINYLNTPPKSKYGKRRKRRLPYGKFHDAPYKIYPKEKNGKKYIQVFLAVDKRKNKCFWGEGVSYPTRRK